MLKNKQTNYKVLYEKYIDQLYSYGRALGVDEDTLYDLIHDVFLHFFDVRTKFTYLMSFRQTDVREIVVISHPLISAIIAPKVSYTA